MKTVLVVSYFFPPAGGAGVQRALKFVKYLGEYGWRPVVLTPRRAAAPLSDASHLADLPPNLAVHRLPNPLAALGGGGGGGGGEGGDGNGQGRGIKRRLAGLVFPDPHLAWLPFALPGALAAVRRQHPAAVYVTAPPFSSFFLGGLVAGLARLPLVLDFRDDWSGFFSKGFAAHGGGRLWRGLVGFWEGHWCRRAAAVIGTTPGMAERLRGLHARPGEGGKYLCIPNGFDPADFAFLAAAPPPPPEPDGRLHLLYCGTVFQSHPLAPLWAGLALLSPAERGRITVEVVGRVVAGETADPGLPGLVTRQLPYEPHDRVVRRMAGAGALLLTMADLPGLERMIPAKLFEYLAVGRPILALCPPGATRRVLAEAGAGAAVSPGRPAELAALLRSWLAAPPPPPPAPPARFDRRRLTGELARVLDRVSGAAGSAPGRG